MIFYGLTLIILGLLAAPSLLLSKKPDAKELLDKITPYQGWIGVVSCFWGLWVIVDAIRWISYISLIPVAWTLWLAVGLLLTVLGFILGYGLIVQYVLSKNEEAAKKGEEVLRKLQPLQGKLGLAGIVLGLIYIVATFIWHV